MCNENAEIDGTVLPQKWITKTIQKEYTIYINVNWYDGIQCTEIRKLNIKLINMKFLRK